MPTGQTQPSYSNRHIHLALITVAHTEPEEVHNKRIQQDISNSKLSKANYTWISLQPFSCILWWHWLFKKILGLVLAWKSGLKSIFNAFRPLLPSANYSAEGSGWVWQPSADSNGCFRHFFNIWNPLNSYYCQQRAVTPSPGRSNPKKCAKLPLLSAESCHPSDPTWWAAVPSENILCRFFSRAEKPSKEIYSK